jgi:membrane protease YdiL (CAAX protease family)
MNSTLSQSGWRVALWSAWVVVALLLSSAGGAVFAVVVGGSALLLAAVPGVVPSSETSGDRRELLVITAMYVVVVGLMRLAFSVFTAADVTGLFLAFTAALAVGAAGPIGYVVWFRRGSLRDLGVRTDNWRSTAALALVFGCARFALTLWGVTLPADRENWVPLLVMTLVVGAFESIFFWGFVQNRVEAQFGPRVGIAAAAALYGLYHVGYGMGANEIGFLFGLGVVYGVAFETARNLLVLWPLLIPLGSFVANLEAGIVPLRWVSILSFGDVLVVIVFVIVLARRHERRRAAIGTPDTRLIKPGRGKPK